MAGEANPQNGAAGETSALRAEHRIRIEAPAQDVWAVLSDLAGWSTWNPVYTAPVCVPKVGETVTATVTMPDSPPNPFTAEICAWEPNRRFGWHSSAMDGQMQMTRYMEIEPVSDNSCMFTNGEAFGGEMGPVIMKDMVGGIANGFRLMSEALKKAVETR